MTRFFRQILKDRAVDIEQARFNMIEQQIRPWDVLDESILAALRRVPREVFVAEGHRELAFADVQIPLGHGEVMMEPRLEARLIQDLSLTAGDKVLEVGTGSGYMTALLATLAGRVVSVDLHGDFTKQAGERLRQLGIDNVVLETGDASRGWPSADGFDAILLTGSVPAIPETLIDALRDGGRLVAVVGSAPVMEAARLVKKNGEVVRTSLFDTILPPLVNVTAPRRFVF